MFGQTNKSVYLCTTNIKCCDKNSHFALNKQLKTKENIIMAKTLESYINELQERFEAKVKAAKRHYDAGRVDCKCGIYDKWYRYNTLDDGRAYDLGWTEQNKTTQNEKVQFIQG